MEIIFATSNINKLNEVCEIIGKKYSIVSPTKYGITQDIPETGDTLESNALIKAQYIWDRTGINCFADDTGLEVEDLNGAPGVRSARYAGEDNNSNNNIDKLLKELSDINNKRARFRTSISLIYKNSIHFSFGFFSVIKVLILVIAQMLQNDTLSNLLLSIRTTAFLAFLIINLRN